MDEFFYLRQSLILYYIFLFIIITIIINVVNNVDKRLKMSILPCLYLCVSCEQVVDKCRLLSTELFTVCR